MLSCVFYNSVGLHSMLSCFLPMLSVVLLHVVIDFTPCWVVILFMFLWLLFSLSYVSFPWAVFHSMLSGLSFHVERCFNPCSVMDSALWVGFRVRLCGGTLICWSLYQTVEQWFHLLIGLLFSWALEPNSFWLCSRSMLISQIHVDLLNLTLRYER